MLTPRQQRFVDEYLVDLNATQAAIRAGYSAKTAEQQGPRLLGYVGVAAAIRDGKIARAAKVELTAEYVLTRLQSVADRCMQAEAVIGRDGERTGEYRFDSSGANRSLELLGKHLGLFADRLLIDDLRDKSDDDLAAELAAARAARARGDDPGDSNSAGADET